jgi:hypothetical protein
MRRFAIVDLPLPDPPAMETIDPVGRQQSQSEAKRVGSKGERTWFDNEVYTA